ncbi:hypothetical protein EC919_11498 [Pseudomonas graminis]|jgi:hypothetical protein|uniref:hypothetical protein n=1 Tax=Pseudomonas graminis TaxID=158627 RepID=UPI00106093C6|nr:hypothetical protein [Pseudomonas graminis]TDV44426.1 hypothetical protein EC919_11498 [Pseudomonas graminis]
MSHPKNSTKPLEAQVPLTQLMQFKAINPESDQIFQVTPGICLVDALENSSCLLSEVLLFIQQYHDEDSGLKTAGVYLIQEVLVSAKAIVDSSVCGLMAAQRAGGAA